MRAYTSPIRLFAFGLLGLLLIIASIDVMFAHWVSTEPENTDGVLTTRGHAQQRGDIVWGAVMLGTGTVLFGGALVELVRRKPQAVISAGGIELPMGKHGDDVTVPWSNIRNVRGDLMEDGFDGAMREQLVIEVLDPNGLPPEPHNAEWRGDELLVDAENWTKGVGEFAIAAQGALGHYRRVDEIKHMEAPSLTWQTSVATAGIGAEEQVAPGGEVEVDEAETGPTASDDGAAGAAETHASSNEMSGDDPSGDVLNGDAPEPPDPEEASP